MAYAPTLSLSLDAAPAPRCLVTFTTLATGTQTITVYRVTEGRQFKVRGGVNLFAVGGAAVMDYEVGLGVAQTYRAEMFDASGITLGFTDTATTTPSPVFPDASWAWISQPLKPTLAVLVPLASETADVLVNPLPGDVYYAEGAPVGTRISGRRQGVAGMKLTFTAQSFADADEFRSMFGDYSSDLPPVVCIRSVPPARIPRVLFASVQQLAESTDYVNSRVIFALTVDEVQPPFPGLVTPILRREDIDAAFSTRAARAAAYATRLARDTDFTKAGLAG